MTSDILKVVESEYDYDASPEAWDEYKKIYTPSKWGFWAKLNYDNLKKQGIRIYAPVKINEKYAQFNQYPKFKMSGDTDFNFGKDKKSKKKYEQFKELLRRDYQRNEFNVYLDELDQCYDRYHKPENFSFMPITGGLQLVKGSCQYDRLDMFVYRLSRYYETKGKDKFILSLATTCNREVLEAYLKLFDSIYDYCSKIYMINSTDLVNKIIAQGEESIDSGARVVRYMKLAEEFWDNKKQTTLKELISLDTAIEKAEQKIEYLSSDEEAMRIYYERERSLHERANMIKSAEERKSIENAINFLRLGVDIETVSKGTGLSIEKVRELNNNL